MLRASWRLASTAVVVGLLGTCAGLVILAGSPGGSGQARTSGPSARQRRPAEAAMAPASLAPSASRAPRAWMARRAATVAARTGMRLMSEAAAACDAVAFRGVQLSDWWGPAGRSVSVIEVWHQPDGELLAQPSGSGSGPGPSRAHQGQPGRGTMVAGDEAMTVTPSLLALMRRNYAITHVGRGTVDGRTAQVVAVTRPDGSLAARFWIDTATRLPLRRELFDSSDQKFSDAAFTTLSLGARQLHGMPAADAQPWAGQLTAADIANLRARGWPVPRSMVGGLALFQSTQRSTQSGIVVELSYSDGLSVISVFEQRGQLTRSLPGWRPIAARGGVIYAADSDVRTLAWSAHGFVYTMISDASAGLVDQAVARLPHDAVAGFWERMGRGFRRLVSWVNPFR